MSRARLTWQEPGQMPRSRDFPSDVSLGRSHECDVQLTEATVSAQHARIGYDEARGAFVLEDLGSKGGTRLDGSPVTRAEALGHLNVIELGGQARLLFQDLDRCEPRHGTIASRPAVVEAPQSAPVAAPSSGSTRVAATPPPVSPPPAAPAAAGPAATEAPPTPAAPEGSTRVIATPPPAAPRPTAPPAPPEGGTQVVPAPAPPTPPAPQPAAPAGRTRVINTPVPPPTPAQNPPQPQPVSNPDAQTVVVEPSSRPPQPALADFELVFEKGGARFLLGEGEHTLGRLPERDIGCPDPQVSRLHATLRRNGDRLTIRDAGSHNGTFVDDHRIETEVELRVGSQLRFGTQRARIERAES